MYHSHSDETQQISSGMDGTIAVGGPGAPGDTASDHVAVLSGGRPTLDLHRVRHRALAARVRGVPAEVLFAPGEIYDVEATRRAGRPLTSRWEGVPGDARTAATMTLVRR
jgi:FtsP/CotA-like multicopper oxidase with cupredoxin domain